VSLRLEPELYARLERLSEHPRHRRTIADVCRFLILSAIDAEEKTLGLPPSAPPNPSGRGRKRKT
jgi:hypothetical protein